MAYGAGARRSRGRMRDGLITNKEAKLCDGFLFLIDAKWD
jgi:hypothetical protein